MLRNLGARSASKETTNFEACRDLSGRRLRDIHEEEMLANWIVKEEERKKNEEEKRKKRQANILEGPSHSFDYNKLGDETKKIKCSIEAAIGEAFSVQSKERVQAIKVNHRPKPLKIWDEDDLSDSSENTEDLNEFLKNTSLESNVDSFTGKATCGVPSDSCPSLDNKSCKESTSGDEIKQKKKPLETNPVQNPIDLCQYKTSQELEELGLEFLKQELLARKLKCGGTLEQRAARLYKALTEGK
ncbi:splicing regulator SDE2-like [Zophobas morio]